MANTFYNPSDFGEEETKLLNTFQVQKADAKNYFTTFTKPRLDRSYKLYIGYTGDRKKEIQKWQANVFVPYTQAVVETLIPRILDARPDFSVQGRTVDDQFKAIKVQNLNDYTWEIANMDDTSEALSRSAVIYGTGYLQASWKKDVREHKFLKTKDLLKKKYTWEKREQVYYDAPYAEWVDNYNLWYDWHNVPRQAKQYWFKRLLLTGAEIKRRYPNADKERLAMAFESGAKDLTDYASIRYETKKTHEGVVKGADYSSSFSGITSEIYQSTIDSDLKMHEVFEWYRPFIDIYAPIVNEVPILNGGFMPIPYDFKEAPFIEVPFLKLPNEFEGVGLPMILENLQVMLNMVKNQRLDAMTLSIHKMWVVNPLANVDKNELVVRPFGIIYSPDPSGVREVQFSDIKASAYREEELLKGDARYASGVDDFSMGVAGEAGSATAVRHLRESTLERVRLFVNHLGSGYSTLMRWWISMYRQFFTKDMTIRVVGEEGRVEFPIIEKDDLKGEFDFKASVIPSIAGKSDIDKKQGMDLFQLLIPFAQEFIDARKLVSKVLQPWGWSIDSIAKNEEATQPMVNPEEAAMLGAGTTMPLEEGSPLSRMDSGDVPASVIKEAVSMLGGTPPFQEASAPINLLEAGPLPPTAPKLPVKTTNPRGLNRGGKVNTNLPIRETYTPEGNLLNRTMNLQR